jgi:hypothetical protein
MTMPQTVTGGSWYTYSDRTIPNSEPPIDQPGAADPGSIVPAEGAMFAPVTDSKSPIFTIDGGMMPMPYREASGGGESTWGAGFGFDITSATPDGGPVGFNSCPQDAGVAMIFDTSGKSDNVGIPIPFDAKSAGYTGVAFYGTSFTSTNETVAVQLDDDRTSPWGGNCAVCQNGGKCSAAEADGGKTCPCSDSYIYSELFPTGKWQRFTIMFSSSLLATANWSTQGLAKGGIDTNSLYNLHFQLTTTSGKALPNFDVGVAYVTWLTN